MIAFTYGISRRIVPTSASVRPAHHELLLAPSEFDLPLTEELEELRGGGGLIAGRITVYH